MSRVGKQPVKIPAGVKFSLTGNEVKVEGPKGKLSYRVPEGVLIQVEKEVVKIDSTPELAKQARSNTSLNGTTRTVIHNMIEGVATGFTRDLEIVGVGFRAAVQGNVLNLSLGFSHPINYELPAGITAKVEKNTSITLAGADKVLLGRVAAKVRGFRKPEPYQGKGVRYVGERIVRKQGKAAGAK